VVLGHCHYGKFRTFTPFQPRWMENVPLSRDGVGAGFIPRTHVRGILWYGVNCFAVLANGETEEWLGYKPKICSVLP